MFKLSNGAFLTFQCWSPRISATTLVLNFAFVWSSLIQRDTSLSQVRIFSWQLCLLSWLRTMITLSKLVEASSPTLYLNLSMVRFFYPKTISLLSLRHLVICFGSLSVDQFQQDMNRSPLVKVTGVKRYFSTTNLNPLSKTRRDQLVLS